jgi:arsenate reductase (thioredoxin)
MKKTYDKKNRVLFVCIHNSARSQMAEAFLNNLAGGRFEAKSAGLEPGKLNPAAVEAMREIGIDISGNKTKSVFDFYKKGEKFDYVVTVCDAAASGRCPVFPGARETMHWGFPDPAGFNGTDEEKLQKTREIRDQIKEKIEGFIENKGKVPHE